MNWTLLTVAATFGIVLSACGGAEPAPDTTPEPAEKPAELSPLQQMMKASGIKAVMSATIRAKSGSKLVGSQVTLTELEDGVKVEVHVAGLEPGKHGCHIHEKGDCSSDDGKSAGGRTAPATSRSSSPAQPSRRVSRTPSTGARSSCTPRKTMAVNQPETLAGASAVLSSELGTS